MYITLKINYKDVTINFQAKNTKSLSSIIEKAGIMLDLQCGGNGSCGKCKVILNKGKFRVNNKRLNITEPYEALSCKTYVESDNAEITVLENSVLKAIGKISTDFNLPQIGLQSHGKSIAIDIGTTTVVVILIDSLTGEIIGRESLYNQQMSKGDDVSARISYISKKETHLFALQDLIVQSTINPLIMALCEKYGVSHKEINRVAVSANTVMSHIFAKLSPVSIGSYPYAPLTNIYCSYKSKDLGLHTNLEASVYIVPSISGYLGGDVIADIAVTNLDKDSDKLDSVLMIDLGTNSEMIFLKDSILFAGSAAAGPAFEGAGLLSGCRAISGAIEKVEIDEDLDFKIKTIDNKAAIGICGSGIIDFIACGFRRGLINSLGRYDEEKLKSIGRFIKIDDKIVACILNKNEESQVNVSEYDIEQILKAKSAVYAGIKTLVAQKQLMPKDITKIILSGGFAKFINIENAIEIGMLPPIEDYEIIGNGSLAGAYLALQKPDERIRYESLITKPEVISLNEDPNFEFNFIDALMIPNYEPNEFE